MLDISSANNEIYRPVNGEYKYDQNNSLDYSINGKFNEYFQILIPDLPVICFKDDKHNLDRKHNVLALYQTEDGIYEQYRYFHISHTYKFDSKKGYHFKVDHFLYDDDMRNVLYRIPLASRASVRTIIGGITSENELKDKLTHHYQCRNYFFIYEGYICAGKPIDTENQFPMFYSLLKIMPAIIEKQWRLNK